MQQGIGLSAREVPGEALWKDGEPRRPWAGTRGRAAPLWFQPFLDHDPGHGPHGSVSGTQLSALTAGSWLATFR